MSDSVKKYFENANSTIPIGEDTDPIVDSVVKKFQERSKIGIEKYGTTLQDSPDGFYSFINHLQEELMDACNYLEKIKQQKL